MRGAVLPSFLRVRWWEGPCRRGGSAWQRQLGWPQRVIRSARVPGRAKPRAAISAAMRAARACWAGVGDTSSILAAGFPHLAHLIKYKCCMSNADVAAYIGRWRPSSVSAQAAAFARDVIIRAGPGGRERAKNLLWAAAKLADYAIPLGLDPVPEVLLHPSVTERFTRAAPGLSGVARRTLRTNLRFIGRRVVPQFYPADVPLPRERAKTPYSPAEIAGYLALADAQPTAARRMRAAGLVTGGADPRRRNLANPLTRALDGGSGLPLLDTSRLRATWLRDCAELLGLATFMAAAGISCSQRLGDLIAGLEPAAEAEAVRLLGAARRP